MNIKEYTKQKWILIAGDVLALLLAIFIGFRTHENVEVFWQRFGFTFFPWLFSWLLTASLVGLYKFRQAKILRQIGQVFFAMLLGSPLAAILRAAWLGSFALPLFALIMGASSGLGIAVWRVIFHYVFSKRAED